MTRQSAVASLCLAAFAAFSGGCACCRHRALYDSLAADDAIETCAARRNDVYVFVLGGTDPFDNGPERLAAGLNEHGFAKVYTGTRFHTGWFAREAARVAQDNPDARFAVVGRRGGATRAAEFAARLSREGLPLDAFILLDPDATPIAHTINPVETVVFHTPDGETESSSVATVLAGVARHVPVEPVARAVPSLVDDPAPAPELIADHPNRTSVPR